MLYHALFRIACRVATDNIKFIVTERKLFFNVRSKPQVNINIVHHPVLAQCFAMRRPQSLNELRVYDYEQKYICAFLPVKYFNSKNNFNHLSHFLPKNCFYQASLLSKSVPYKSWIQKTSFRQSEWHIARNLTIATNITTPIYF